MVAKPTPKKRTKKKPPPIGDHASEVRNVTQYARIPIDQLKPNPWNPNRMDDEEFAKYVAEVKHLGRVPKPTVVRANGSGFEVVDGEHGWRAASEIGLEEIDCEIVDVDDFEAMRQTFKRNQSGKHNMILQGRMFRQMMETKKLSKRKLAEKVNVSEGTIRNSVAFAGAVDSRIEYLKTSGVSGPEQIAFDEFNQLTIRHIRTFAKLVTNSPVVANSWIGSGADIKTIYSIIGVNTDKPFYDFNLDILAEATTRLESYADLIVDYCGEVKSKSGFLTAIKNVKNWSEWEGKWQRRVDDHESLRGFARHHFQGDFFVDSLWSMDSIMGLIVDQEKSEFLITNSEFDDCLKQQHSEPSRRRDFEERIKLLVITKHGKLPACNSNIRDSLEEHKFNESAPDFIKESEWTKRSKFELNAVLARTPRWAGSNKELFNTAIEYCAGMPEPRFHGKENRREVIEKRIRKVFHVVEERRTMAERAATASEKDLADSIVELFCGDNLNSAEQFKKKLATFDKRELVVLQYLTDRLADFRSFWNAFGVYDNLNDDEFKWINELISDSPE